MRRAVVECEVVVGKHPSRSEFSAALFFSHVVGRRTIFQLETVRRCTETETVGLRVILTGLSARHCNISFAATFGNLVRDSSYKRTTLENSISILLHIILNLTFCIFVARLAAAIQFTAAPCILHVAVAAAAAGSLT